MPPFDGAFALDYAYPLAFVAYNDPWNSASADQQPAPPPPPYPLLETFTEVGQILVSPGAVAHLTVQSSQPLSPQERLLQSMLQPSGGSSRSAASPVPLDRRFGWVCLDPAAKRLIVTFRGTQTTAEWLDDFDFLYEPYRPVALGGTVHAGFQYVYYAIRDSLLGLVQPLFSQAAELLVVGHSLGSSLATLALPDLLHVAATLGFNPQPLMYNFASPRVGLEDFKLFFNRQSAAWRVANLWDVVPHLPPVLAGYLHVGEQLTIDSGFSIDIASNHRLPTGYLPGLQAWVQNHQAAYKTRLPAGPREVPPGVSD